jgi:hypothetical protein
MCSKDEAFCAQKTKKVCSIDELTLPTALDSTVEGLHGSGPDRHARRKGTRGRRRHAAIIGGRTQ